MRPRLQDVADRAGVSMKTVSNVINGFAHVSEGTRAKVQVAIEEMGYQPNLSARNLARGRAGMIGLVVPRIDMPYFASLAMHVLEAAARRGWVVVIHQTLGDLGSEQEVLRGRFPQRIDGLVLSPLRVSAEEVAAREGALPLVLLGDRSYGSVADHVMIDNAAAARSAVLHLLDLGRRRVAMIGAQWGDPSNPRLAGYRQALAERGLRADPSLVVATPDVRGEEGEEAMVALLAALPQVPDAVFCATDWMAMGALRALRLRGLRVPEDVALVGFDDIPYGRVSTPTLTTVSPHRGAVAEAAVASLEAQLAGTRREAVEVVIPHELVVRESTSG